MKSQTKEEQILKIFLDYKGLKENEKVSLKAVKRHLKKKNILTDMILIKKIIAENFKNKMISKEGISRFFVDKPKGTKYVYPYSKERTSKNLIKEKTEKSSINICIHENIKNQVIDDFRSKYISSPTNAKSCKTCLLERSGDCVGSEICSSYDPCPALDILKTWHINGH